MSASYLTPEVTTEDRSGRERLGLSFTIDYLLFNKGAKDSSRDFDCRKPKEVVAVQERSAETGERDVRGEEGDEERQDEGEEEVTNTCVATSDEKPNQSYIALISKAILASEEKKLLLCDIYQWIMDHYPYFKSKDKNWRNSVRHNLSLNDCFVKAGRSENGKGHFWAVHPSNYKDFSNGDYHCRRTRRRVRRVAGQLPLSPLGMPFHLARHHRATCWCCPQVHTLPLPCFPPRLYWPWSSVQVSGLHVSGP
ncbi:forkhead box Q2 [Corythoichthys intestinalis]|uniref:forkhead box Q2 n=1 Tax=Corythoichthys intestinalis TaxID=161448 RepID=UPI0025A5E3C4|nr:forkhead box Q2 [Corythoichthys intestinalis]XP_061790613.1 forkhead box protein B2-like [Nerophis lumbriciformis]